MNIGFMLSPRIQLKFVNTLGSLLSCKLQQKPKIGFSGPVADGNICHDLHKFINREFA